MLNSSFLDQFFTAHISKMSPKKFGVGKPLAATIFQPYAEHFVPDPCHLAVAIEEYEVERIIDHLINSFSNKKEFLVKWKGLRPNFGLEPRGGLP